MHTQRTDRVKTQEDGAVGRPRREAPQNPPLLTPRSWALAARTVRRSFSTVHATCSGVWPWRPGGAHSGQAARLPGCQEPSCTVGVVRPQCSQLVLAAWSASGETCWKESRLHVREAFGAPAHPASPGPAWEAPRGPWESCLHPHSAAAVTMVTASPILSVFLPRHVDEAALLS